MRDLDRHELKFIDAYLDTHDPAQAAIIAGYDLTSRAQARAKGHEILSRPWVQQELEAYVSRFRERYAVDPDNIRQEVAKVAFSDVRDLFVMEPVWSHPEEDHPDRKQIGSRVRVDLTRLDAITARAIAEIRHDKNGYPIIKMHSKLHALELLARMEKMLTDRVEVDDVRDPVKAIREARQRARQALIEGRDVFDDDDHAEVRLETGAAGHQGLYDHEGPSPDGDAAPDPRRPDRTR